MATAWSSCTHAVIVCGHAIFTAGSKCPQSEAAYDSNWILQSFQAGEGADYIRHIKNGVLLAADDSRALLMFSGAQSRPAAPHSEAVGYVHAAEAHSWWGVPHVAARTTTEEFARDSFENVLFGIARFFECVGSFPEELTVVSWTFKQGRFIAHAKALHWPMTSFVFAGVSNPQAAALTSALIAEERTLHSFNADPTGSAPGGELLEKRASRNPARRQHGYAISCPLLAPIFAWEGPAHLPVEACPWSEEKVN